MKNKILTIALILFFTNCNNRIHPIENIKEIVTQVQQELDEELFKVISIKDDKDLIVIELSINQKFIVHQNHQLILIQKILYDIGSKGNIHNQITFKYYLANESDNITETTYSQNDIIEWVNFYENNTFFSKAHQKALESFSLTSIFALNTWLEKVHVRYNTQIPLFSFLDLIYELNNECVDDVKSKKAKMALVVSYVAIDDYIENGQLLSSSIPDQNDNLEFLKALWKYCSDGEDITAAENRLFGKIGGNWQIMSTN